MTYNAPSIGAALVALVFVAGPSLAGAQAIRLTLENGRVTLDATDATPSAILAEWARVGGTRIVDGDRVPGAPVTLRLEGVPEREALDIILRSAAGYIAAARPAGAPGASAFDRIVVMPVSVNAAAARTGPAPAMAAAPIAVAPQVPDAAFSASQEAVQDTSDVAMASDDASGAEQPVSATDFDYANPQRYFAARAAQQRAAEAAAQQDDAGAVGGGQVGVTAVPGGFGTGAVLSSPGMLPVPQAQPAAPSSRPPVNPYGLPADTAPGSSTAAPMEPDRSKYINPYAPTPTPPQ